MASLAIKGHPTRGSEVIALLEMLGGINQYAISADAEELSFTIRDNDNYIVACYPTGKFIFFTLEDFEEKFPYKVGDKVWLHYENLTIRVTETITCMRWCNRCNCVLYDVSTCCDLRESAFTPYKEETMEERQYKELRMPLDDDDKLATEVTIDDNKILPPNGYLIGKITQVDNGMLVEYVKQLPQYPKTYEECCDILQLEHIFELKDLTMDEEKLIDSFIRLKRCRDAYWKIAGKQMGLRKPWEPDWENKENNKYCITTINKQIKIVTTDVFNYLLIFPTIEMRDAFYENFKELIELCKELL